jgi:8-oxo-dGTP diphosphatase
VARATRSIEAAGAVTFRPDGDVLLVHRPQYDDWSLPKGKIDHDEYLARTAVREVAEETSVRIRLGMPLRTIGYMTERGAKRVHFWRGSVLKELSFAPNSEVDAIAWVPPATALRQLSYVDERHVLEEAMDTPTTTPVLIVRHGKAMDRKNWSAKDAARPLTTRGRKQAIDLISLFDAFDVRSVVSSASVRCVQTLRPYARQLRTEVETWSVLSEEHGIEHPKDVRKLMNRLVAAAIASDSAIAVCGHRPVLPTMFESLGVEARHIVPATAVVAHLDGTGTVRATEWYRPLR